MMFVMEKKAPPPSGLSVTQFLNTTFCILTVPEVMKMPKPSLLQSMVMLPVVPGQSEMV